MNKVWTIFFIFCGVYIIAEILVVSIMKKKEKDKKQVLEEECSLWTIFIREFENNSKENKKVLHKDLYNKLKTKIDDLDEIKHGICVISGDLETINFTAIIYSVVFIGISTICKVIAFFVLSDMVGKIIEYEIHLDIMTGVLELIMISLIICILYPYISIYKKEKYFLEFLKFALEEKQAETRNEGEQIVAAIKSLQKEVEAGNQRINNKSNFGIHLTWGKES